MACKCCSNDFDDYQRWTGRFVKYARYENVERKMYPALGLAGETGEVCEKIKKEFRDGELDVEGLKLELGDVLWYLARVAAEYGFSLGDVAMSNVEKLEGRRERGTLQGSGDKR